MKMKCCPVGAPEAQRVATGSLVHLQAVVEADEVEAFQFKIQIIQLETNKLIIDTLMIYLKNKVLNKAELLI